jgi:hypothetical protein
MHNEVGEAIIQHFELTLKKKPDEKSSGFFPFRNKILMRYE